MNTFTTYPNRGGEKAKAHNSTTRQHCRSLTKRNDLTHAEDLAEILPISFLIGICARRGKYRGLSCEYFRKLITNGLRDPPDPVRRLFRMHSSLQTTRNVDHSVKIVLVGSLDEDVVKESKVGFFARVVLGQVGQDADYHVNQRVHVVRVKEVGGLLVGEEVGEEFGHGVRSWLPRLQVDQIERVLCNKKPWSSTLTQAFGILHKNKVCSLFKSFLRFF